MLTQLESAQLSATQRNVVDCNWIDDDMELRVNQPHIPPSSLLRFQVVCAIATHILKLIHMHPQKRKHILLHCYFIDFCHIYADWNLKQLR